MSEWKVANYELSLRLRGLGVRQDKSERVYRKLHELDGGIVLARRADLKHLPHAVCDDVAALDGAELGVALPYGFMQMVELDGGYVSWNGTGISVHANRLGDAMGGALIQGLESGCITVEGVNRRLRECQS